MTINSRSLRCSSWTSAHRGQLTASAVVSELLNMLLPALHRLWDVVKTGEPVRLAAPKDLRQHRSQVHS